MRRRYALISILVVALIGISFYWFAMRHAIYPSAIENAASVSYSYLDHLGKQRSDLILSSDDLNEVRGTLKKIHDSDPARVIRPENRTTGVIITFSMLGPDQQEIKSYSINGEYLAVGLMDKPVTIYSVAEEEMDHLRDIFRSSTEK